MQLAMNNPVFRSYHKALRIKYHFVFVIKYQKYLFLDENYVKTFKDLEKNIQ